MTRDEGAALEVGATVYFGNDPRDRGTVRANDGRCVVIRWGRDAADSQHQVTNLARVHRWQRGLRGLPRAVERQIAGEV